VAKDTQPAGQPGKGRLSGREIAVGVLALIILVFVVENGRSVRIRFIIPQVKAPLALALVVAFAVGVAAGLLIRRRRKD
jgi:uncharacterized integral membrane protein